jgi:hypothetical protein
LALPRLLVLSALQDKKSRSKMLAQCCLQGDHRPHLACYHYPDSLSVRPVNRLFTVRASPFILRDSPLSPGSHTPMSLLPLPFQNVKYSTLVFHSGAKPSRNTPPFRHPYFGSPYPLTSFMLSSVPSMLTPSIPITD